MESDESSSIDDDFLIYENSSLIPSNPGTALDNFLLAHKQLLSKSEKEYLSLYNTIWYYTKNLDRFKCNGEGRYKVNIGDCINCQYEIISSLGGGAFSNVYKVFDYKHDQEFALKIIRNEPRFILQAQKEMELLTTIDHPNCTRVASIFSFNNSFGFTFPIYKHNLYEELKANNMQGLEELVVKRYGKELLQGLDYLKKRRIVHADLKPENIMVDLHGSLKIIDFGSSWKEKEIKKIYTYIQSRYYRAPEIPLGLGVTCAIDIWSFACILYELLTGKPLFHCKSEKQLVVGIIGVIDMPPDYLINKGTQYMNFFRFSKSGQQWVLYEKLYKPTFIPGSKKLSLKNKDLENVFNYCLQWDPDDRCYPSDLLSNKYFN